MLGCDLMATLPPLRRLTVNEAITEYSRSLERRVLGGAMSSATRDTYLRDLRDFATLAGPETVLDDLTAETLDDVVLEYARLPDKRFKNVEKEKGHGVVARFRQSVSGLFAFADRQGFIQFNPVPDMVVKPRQPAASGSRVALSLESATAVLDTHPDGVLGVRNSLILQGFLETGLRNAELCALDVSDVSLEDGQPWLTVRHGKGGKRRVLPLTMMTYERIGEYVALRSPAESFEEALFLTKSGRRIAPRDVQNICRAASRMLPHALRRDFTPHALRHTMATLSLAHGSADVAVVQRLLGHSSLAVTGRYLDEVRDELVRAVDANPLTGRGR